MRGELEVVGENFSGTPRSLYRRTRPGPSGDDAAVNAVQVRLRGLWAQGKWTGMVLRPLLKVRNWRAALIYIVVTAPLSPAPTYERATRRLHPFGFLADISGQSCGIGVRRFCVVSESADFRGC